MPSGVSTPFDGGHALARQCGLVDLKGARVDDPAVRGDLVSSGEQDDVADDQLLGGYLRFGAVAADSGDAP